MDGKQRIGDWRGIGGLLCFALLLSCFLLGCEEKREAEAGKRQDHQPQCEMDAALEIEVRDVIRASQERSKGWRSARHSRIFILNFYSENDSSFLKIYNSNAFYGKEAVTFQGTCFLDSSLIVVFVQPSFPLALQSYIQPEMGFQPNEEYPSDEMLKMEVYFDPRGRRYFLPAEGGFLEIYRGGM